MIQTKDKKRRNPKVYAGVDVGSITAKAAIIKEDRVVGTNVIPTGYRASTVGRRVFEELLQQTGIAGEEVKAVVATGYGRNSVDFAARSVTEIICHGTGAFFLAPHTRGIIDVGGQDSKAILLNDQGGVDNFAMNDKCAAGTGRFLEVMARVMEVDLDDMGEMGLAATTPSRISSICTVFAESEVISMISGQHRRQDIIAGIHDSAAARIASLALKIKIKPPVMMTGGVAKNIGMVRALESLLGLAIDVLPSAQVNGAIGAAVRASRL
ncbi:MAG TPA: acyl-CoA dehydratase activase [Desulfobacteraceae bacterium]|nr:acyl-CoA dehydratase activase [Desulfobacteraceae bacterium]